MINSLTPLEEGMTIYFIEHCAIESYVYLRPMDGEYHILIDRFTKEPVRYYEERIRDYGYLSHRDAINALIKRLKSLQDRYQERLDKL